MSIALPEGRGGRQRQEMRQEIASPGRAGRCAARRPRCRHAHACRRSPAAAPRAGGRGRARCSAPCRYAAGSTIRRRDGSRRRSARARTLRHPHQPLRLRVDLSLLLRHLLHLLEHLAEARRALRAVRALAVARQRRRRLGERVRGLAQRARLLRRLPAALADALRRLRRPSACASATARCERGERSALFLPALCSRSFALSTPCSTALCARAAVVTLRAADAPAAPARAPAARAASSPARPDRARR